jgi:hypothetical protein
MREDAGLLGSRRDRERERVIETGFFISAVPRIESRWGLLLT